MFQHQKEYQRVQLGLPNGWHVSVVQGRGTYSTEGTVEIAVRDASGKFRRLGRDWGDDVLGHVNAEGLAKQLSRAWKLALKNGR